jgi:hypothetical protein
VHLTPKLVERYHFLKFPRTFEEHALSSESGIAFEGGEWEGVTIDELRLFNNGILVVTGESTDRGEALFGDMTKWFVEDLGLIFEPQMVASTIYVSQLAVRSKVALDSLLNPAVIDVAARFASGSFGLTTLGLFTGENVEATEIRIERLATPAGLPPSQPNEFWTQAPLPTSRHLEFLTALEDALTR